MNDEANLRRPLEGIRVLDLTVALSGPYGALLLAGLGAEVIKIEAPQGGDIARTNPPFHGKGGIHFGAAEEGDVSLSILARGRSKKSVTIDLKTEEGRGIFHDLARHADVVFENLSDGTAERLGADCETLQRINPRLVYASINGLGRPSLYPGVKAMDITVQALSGAMDTTGEADGPPMRFGLPIADLLTPLYAVIGIQAALRQREVTGEGQHVVVSMLECLASLLAFEHLDVLQRNGFPPRSGNSHNRLTPFGVFRTQDGYVSIAAPTEAWVVALFDAMGQPELIRDPRFSSRGPRSVNSGEMNALIEGWTSGLRSAEVIAALQEQRGVPCVPVRRAVDVLSDPALFAAGALQELQHPVDGKVGAVGAGVPIHMSGSVVGLDRPAQPVGADTDDVLGQLLGLDAAALAGLRARKVV